MASDADAQIQQALQAIAAAAATGSASEVQPIGVPPGYEVERPAAGPSAPGKVQQVPARYFDGDEWLPGATLRSSEIADLQRQMVAAGLIPRGTEYRNGYWDDVTRAGYRALLAESNGSGLTAQQQLRVRQDTAAANRTPFQAPTRLRPDPARLRENVRDLFSTVVGGDREPTTGELDELTAAFTKFDQDAYTSNVAGARAEYDAAQAAADGGTYTAPAVQNVDASARFEEFFRDRYRPEIDMRRGITDLSNGRENLQGSIFAIDQAIAGSVQ
jgi:hypothetical protein